MAKKIIQVCFSLKNGLTIDTIREKLTNLKTRLDNEYGDSNYQVRSCHLSKKLCQDKGFTTEVPDLFEEIFGTNYECELTEDTFDEAMANINRHREELSTKADRLAILSETDVTNVTLELEMFTNNRVIIQ